MFLIMGIRIRAKHAGSGEFFCAHCGADRSYVLLHLRRWFTLFFVPLFPVGRVVAEQVQCTTCHTRYPTSVLNAPTSAAFSENLRGATRVAAVAMLVAGDVNQPAARAAAVDAARRSGSDNYDDSWLTNDVSAVDASQLDAYLRPLADGLSLPGKETFVEQIARVGLADGPLRPSETQLIETIGAALGLSAAHVRGILVSTPAGAPGPSGTDGPTDLQGGA